jgi:outer membrane receptor protein involved in Fe transport
LSGLVRFRPFKGLGLNAEYTYERAKRKHSKEWDIAEKTTQRKMTLSTNIMPLNKLTFKLRYAHRDINDPAYNVRPDTSNEGSISMSWSPFTWANALLSYTLVKEKRDNLHFLDTDTGSIDAKNRRVKRDKLLGSITFVLFDKLSVTPSYAYFHNEIKQDLIYNTPPPSVDQIDTDVAYKDTAHSYALNLSYAPTSNFNINADASETKGKGSFYPGISAALQPTSIASFSELKVKETGYSIGSDYRFKGDWAVGIKYRYNSFRDLINNVYDDAENGIVRIVMLTLSKRW